MGRSLWVAALGVVLLALTTMVAVFAFTTPFSLDLAPAPDTSDEEAARPLAPLELVPAPARPAGVRPEWPVAALERPVAHPAAPSPAP